MVESLRTSLLTYLGQLTSSYGELPDEPTIGQGRSPRPPGGGKPTTPDLKFQVPNPMRLLDGKVYQLWQSTKEGDEYAPPGQMPVPFVEVDGTLIGATWTARTEPAGRAARDHIQQEHVPRHNR